MKRRLLLLAALVAILAQPAFAEDAGGGDSGQGSGGSGSDDGGGDDAGGDDGSDPSIGGGPANKDGTSEIEIDSTGVLPLSQMLAMVRARGVTVVDVRLVERKQVLVYSFKVIDAQGRVGRAYFDAHTGKALV